MQELIEKSKVLNLIKDIKNQTLWLSEILELFNKIHSLPTTVHHEYKVGELMDFSEEWEEWHT